MPSRPSTTIEPLHCCTGSAISEGRADFAADAIVIGSRSDPHVQAVLSQVGDLRVVVLDVETLAASSYSLTVGSHLRLLEPSGDWVTLSADRPVRGWIRRLASPEWQKGVVLESQDAAEKTAWLALLSAIVRTLGVHWLTPLEPLVGGENKVVQYARATLAGIRVPNTVVASDSTEVASVLVGDIVVKPLGPGHFYMPSGEAKVVFATAMGREEAREMPWGTAPFLAQERVSALRHYRVVTVANEVWAGVLDARGLPVDWRAEAVAHTSFASVTVPPGLAAQAVKVASQFGVGYSSQDWAEDDSGLVFLDLNPSGQWLFLPQPEARAVTSAIAGWITEGVVPVA